MRHKKLLESEATLVNYQEAKRQREEARDAQLKAEEAEQKRLINDINGWLKPAESLQDYEQYLNVRQNPPGTDSTGRWILRARKVKAWLDPTVTNVPIIWLYGIVGAGKFNLT